MTLTTKDPLDASRADPRKRPSYGLLASLRISVGSYAIGEWPSPQVKHLRLTVGRAQLYDAPDDGTGWAQREIIAALKSLELSDDCLAELLRAVGEL